MTVLNIEELKKMSPDKRLAFFKSIPKDKLAELEQKLLDLKEGEVSKERVNFYEPYPWQEKFIELLHTKMTVFAPSPNKLGKSITAICIAISWMKGYEPWNEVDKNYPGAVRVRDKYYKPSSLGIKPPVDIVMCGEDWKEHIGKTLVPEFKNWAALGEFTAPRKNEQGIENFWVHKNKSTLTFMCYTQDDKVFESSKIQGALLDEPPPQAKFEALKRGLFYDRGKIVITATPLSEAWLLDELVLKIDPEIGVMKGLTILDNPDKYNNEKSALQDMKMTEEDIKTYFNLLIYDDPVKKTCVKDQGKKAEKFVRKIADEGLQYHMEKLDILRFVKGTHPDKAPARFHGTFRALVGKVIKNFDADKHIIEAMPIMSNWMVVPFIDWHPGTEIALSAYAITEYDMTFVIDEVWQNMLPEDLAEILINWKVKDSWRIKDVFIDPLAKGDVGYVKNRMGNVQDSFTIIEKKIRPYGMRLVTASKDEPSGIMNIESMLDGPNGIPLLYFFDSLQSNHGNYGHLFEVERWTRDENGKPKGEYGHFMENLYRKTLDGIKYKPPVLPGTGYKSSAGRSDGPW